MTHPTPRGPTDPNLEGLTFREWLTAADPARGADLVRGATLDDLREWYPDYVRAWLEGEDPTDWRAVLETKQHTQRAG